MAPDFKIIAEKITQLADLTQQLRRENADLRLRAAALTAENADLSSRMQAARQKVANLMEKYPTPADAIEEETQ